MYIFFIILIGLLSIPIIFGPINAQQIDVIFELKKLSSPCYRIGISYEFIHEHKDFDQYEFSIGLFFVNFVIVFYKIPA
jgi:hypothetical protein